MIFADPKAYKKLIPGHKVHAMENGDSAISGQNKFFSTVSMMFTNPKAYKKLNPGHKVISNSTAQMTQSTREVG